MVFKYKRKTNQASWSEETLRKAMKEVKEGQSINATATKYGIPYVTLHRHLKSGSTVKKLGRFATIFTPDQEQALCEYLMKLDSLFYGLTRIDFLRMAFDYAEKNNIPHSFKNGKAGNDWFAGFKKRHPDIVLRSPEPTSIARTRGFNRPQVELFYSNFWNQVEKHNFDATTIYNMDETGVKTTTSKPPKVLTLKGKKRVGVVGSAERGQLTTVICCCNAAGTFIPPFFIFARKRMQERLLDGSPPGSQATVTDNGWINGPAFLNWLQFFVEKTRPTTDKKVLLLLDNHESHKFFPALEYASKNNVVFVSFAPHTTDRMQPLDVAIYGPLKKYFEQELNTFQKSHPGRIINQYDITKLFGGAYPKCASVHNAIQGFRKPGIWPYNPNAFGDEDYAPSAMTDRPLDAEATVLPPSVHEENNQPIQSLRLLDAETSILPATSQETNNSPVLSSLIGPSTDADTTTEQNLNDPPSSPSVLTVYPLDAEITVPPSTIQEKNYPQAVPPNTYRSLNPETTSILSTAQEENDITLLCTIAGHPMNDETVLSNDDMLQLPSDDLTILEERVMTPRPEPVADCISPFVVRPIPTMSAPKTNRKRKCQKSEVLTSTPVKKEQAVKFKKINAIKTKISDIGPSTSKKGRAKQINKKKTNKTDFFCLVCSEKYIDPPIEEWIQCAQCSQWAHEECTSYAGRGSYFCDECED